MAENTMLEQIENLMKKLKKSPNKNISKINIEDLIELLLYKDELINLIKNKHIQNKKDLIIDTNIIEEQVQNRNFKIYKNVIKELKELQKQYPSFKMVDLVSSALHEYYLNHKKD